MSAVAFSIAATVLLILGAYRIIWQRRFGPLRASDHGFLRFRGTVKGPGDDRSVVYPTDAPGASVVVATDAGKEYEISVDDVALARGGKLHVGDRVSIDALALQHSGESTYRASALVEVIQAVRVARGTWPAGQRLVRATWAAAALAGVFGLSTLLDARGTPVEILLYRTARNLKCQPGTSQTTVSAGLFFKHYCADDAGRKQGPYMVWDWAGTLHEQGTYNKDKLDGAQRVNRPAPTLRMVERQYFRGQRHGPEWKNYDDKRVELRPHVNGLVHGTVVEWYPGRASLTRRMVRPFRKGLAVGTWRAWDKKGRLLFDVPNVADGAIAPDKGVFRDEHTGKSCVGSVTAARDWARHFPARCVIRCVGADNPDTGERPLASCTSRQVAASK